VTDRGSTRRSAETVELKSLTAARVLMGIDVVDHIILGDVRHCSFREAGRI